MILGTKRRVAAEFGSTPGYGMMGVIKITDSKAPVDSECKQFTEKTETHGILMHAAKQSSIWSGLTYFLIAVNVLIFLVSLGYFIYYVLRHIREKEHEGCHVPLLQNKQPEGQTQT